MRISIKVYLAFMVFDWKIAWMYSCKMGFSLELILLRNSILDIIQGKGLDAQLMDGNIQAWSSHVVTDCSA